MSVRSWLAAFALLLPLQSVASGSVSGTDVAEIRAVYRPASVSFLELVVMGGEVVQQKDGSWRTNGCHLVQPSRIISA